MEFPRLSRRVLLGGACLVGASRIAAADKPVGLRTDLGVWTDDWDGLLHRRVVRMLVPYSRTLFFQDRGTLYGVSVDAAQLLEGWINKTFKTGKRPLVVALIPTTRDKLFTELLAGRGDIAAGDVTITPERTKLVSFTVPTVPNVSEVLVTRADAPHVTDASGLSGMEVAVREGTSFHESLQSLNKSLTDAGKPPVKLSLVPPALEKQHCVHEWTVGRRDTPINNGAQMRCAGRCGCHDPGRRQGSRRSGLTLLENATTWVERHFLKEKMRADPVFHST